MNIREWHKLLYDHYRDLHGVRPPEWPLFALEHALSANQIANLTSAVHSDIASRAPSDDSWLPWIIYASEIGYEYEGYEYWQSFEEKTPGWIEHGDRYWIREKFWEFSRQFGGARPLGLWAEHFTIICWPITHAILPKDLQRQLAKVLYDLRYSFNESLLQSPDQLGEHIANRASYGTTRFQQFTQNTSLVGQIATALLFQEEQVARTLLLPVTLQRIIKDLEQEQRAREWLRDARSRAQRIKLEGLSRGTRPQRTDIVAPQETRTEITALAIEPRLILRPAAASTWNALLEIPDFAPLLNKFPALRSVLMGSRCTVKGSSGPLARGRLLNYGSQRVPIQQWPRSNDVLLQFEQRPPKELENLLRAECLLRPGPTWLCRIASDGLAYEVRTLVVRPQSKYIVISTAGPIETGPFTETISVACDGIDAAQLNIPEAVSAETEEYVESIGLNLSKSIRVWPAGLMASSWDGEGQGEWLSNEKPAVGVRTDYAIDAMLLRLDDEQTSIFETDRDQPGTPVFVQLPMLSLGLHYLRVFARSSESDGQFDELGQLEIVIREPRPWTPGVNNQSALIVLVDPTKPTLEQLLEGGVRVESQGPRGRRVTTTITLTGEDSQTPLLTKKLPPLPLPINSDTWQKCFDQHLQDERAQNAVELASSCILDLDGEELGTFSFICERELTPIRWIIQTTGRKYILCLADDSGKTSSTEVVRYDFAKPDAPIHLFNADIVRNYSAPASGGMYTARTPQGAYSIVIPHEIRTWGDLRMVTPQFINRPRSVETLMGLLELLEIWSNAQTRNLFAKWAQRETLCSLLTQTFALICGQRWETAENTFRRNTATTAAVEELSQAIPTRRNEENLRAVMLRQCHGNETKRSTPKDYASELASTMRGLVEPLRLTSVESPSGDMYLVTPRLRRGIPWYTEFALRLASAPETVREWSEEWLKAGFNQLLEAPILARSARFMVLAVDYRLHNADPGSRTSLFAGWHWS